MRVLVTGGAGFVGGAVTEQLVSCGVEYDLCDTGWFLEAYTQRPPAIRFADFRDLSCEELSAYTVVIHLAGLSNDPLGNLTPQRTLSLNHTATVDLAKKAKQAGVQRFVFASTCSVYGDSGLAILDEWADCAPITPYAHAKHLAEQELVGLMSPEFSVAIFRGATAFGATSCPRTDLLLNEFCANAAVGRPLKLSSDGKSWRPFMPVVDFANALVSGALFAPQAIDTLPIWNVAPPDMQMTVSEAAKRAARACHAPDPVFGADKPADLRSYRVNGQRLQSAFPQFSYSDDFEARIRETVEAFSHVPDLAYRLDHNRFVRLAMLPQEATGEHLELVSANVV